MRQLHVVVPGFFILLLIAGLSPAQDTAPGFADPLLGRWDMTVQGATADYPSWLELSLRREDQLMGRFVGRVGSVRHIAELSYSDGQLRFAVPVQYEPGGADLVFEGRLVNGLLTGTTVEPGGERVAWSAIRAPLLDADMGAVTSRREHVLIRGDSLDGWRPRFDNRPDCWTVTNGILSATPPCVDLITEETFTDFRLTLDLRYPQGSNSGVYLRGRHEVQVQDDVGRAVDALRMGGVYGFIAPMTNAARAAGEWQQLEITLVGRRVTVVLNGETVINNQVIPGITGGALDSNEHLPGPIMLQGDHGPVEFANIVLSDLESQASEKIDPRSSGRPEIARLHSIWIYQIQGMYNGYHNL